MSAIEPGWYKDPAEPTTQRFWDGEGWLGEPIPADATPTAGPPPASAPATPVSATPVASTAATATSPTPARAPSPWPAGPLPPGPGGGGPTGWPPSYPPTLTEPRPHGLRLASPGARLVARIVDILAVFALCVIANAWFAIEYWRDVRPFVSGYAEFIRSGQTDIESLPAPPESATFLLLLMGVVATAVWFAYEVPASANSGQTLGKKLLGIKVVRLESEERLGFGRALRRWSRLGLPTLLWAACCGLSALLQVIDCLFVVIDRPLRQALHDRGAATVVVEVPRASRPETARTSVTEPTTTGGRHADPR